MDSTPGPSKPSDDFTSIGWSAKQEKLTTDDTLLGDLDNSDEMDCSDEEMFTQDNDMEAYSESDSEDSDNISSSSKSPVLKTVKSEPSDDLLASSSNTPKDPLSTDNKEEFVRKRSTRQKNATVSYQSGDLSDVEKPTKNVWSSDSSSMRYLEYNKERRLLIPLPEDPYEAFRLFIDDNLLDIVVEETNKYAEKVYQAEGVTPKSRISHWKSLTRDELMTFLGLLLHTGTIRMNRLTDYWKKHWLFNLTCFAKYMSRNRFMIILNCLQFSSIEDSTDRLAKIRPIIDHFNGKMKSLYCPGKQLAIEETAVMWWGRQSYHKRNRQHKYGIKLYVLAEPDGTILKYHVYAGPGNDIREVNKEKIVMDLLEEKLDIGHSVFMGEYYNSNKLAAKLLDRQTYCTGTLSKRSKGLPSVLKSVNLKPGENKSVFSNGVHIGKWRGLRRTFYLTTEFDDEMVEVANKRGNFKLKPKAIVHYNNCVTGILQDQMMSYYPCNRKTMLWHQNLFLQTLQMCMNNAFYIYTNFCATKKMDIYDFRQMVLERILPEEEPSVTPVIKPSHALNKITKFKVREKRDKTGIRIVTEIVRKECRGCRAKKKRTATLYECIACDGSPGYCTTCFCEAHS